jgi:hypothetical protein
MKAQKFFDLIQETRAAQIAWYQDHRRSDLIKAKRLEKLLDVAIKEGLDPEQPAPQAKQLELLQEDDHE